MFIMVMLTERGPVTLPPFLLFSLFVVCSLCSSASFLQECKSTPVNFEQEISQYPIPSVYKIEWA